MSTAKILATLALALGAGCTGLISAGGGANTGTPEEQAAKTAFIEKALPVLNANCVACHNGSQSGIDFLKGDSDLGIRDTVIAFDPPVVNFDAPQSSRILTKGAHNGPALLADQASALLEWLNAEKAALPDPGSTGTTLTTAKFIPVYCTGGDPGTATCPINTVDLSPLGVAGATITFTAQPVSSGLYLNRLTVNGAAAGVYIEHPLFASYLADGTTVVDTIDRFYAVKLDLMPTTSSTLAGGQAGFQGFGASSSDMMSISFKALTAYVADTGTGGGSNSGGGGGCKVLATFKTAAQGALTTSCATNCHGGGQANAKSAMDLSGLVGTVDDTSIMNACNQARTQINFQTTDLSGFFVAPNPADNTNHPFKFNGNQGNFNSFKAAVDPWVQAEKTAP